MSLREWFDKMFSGETLFQENEEFNRIALASLLFHVINADGVETDKEKRKFQQIMTEQFVDLEPAAVAELYRRVKASESDLATDLNTLRTRLKDSPNVRRSLMSTLNKMVNVDGVSPKELEVFQEATRVMFPEAQSSPLGDM